MNSQLLPSNSIRGGKQRPARALEEAWSTGSCFLPSFPRDSLGTRDCIPRGHRGGASPPSSLEARGCVIHPGLGWRSCSLTFPTWLFPHSNLPWISLQVFVSLCIFALVEVMRVNFWCCCEQSLHFEQKKGLTPD